MKIQCDVCEKAQATVICCADEAALCAKCDVEVHEANRLASKHQRLLLDSLSTKLPRCDICQEKTAFIFCVEDRALFCQDCDEPVHSAGSIASNHQRLLATGIKVALGSKCAKNTELIRSEPPNQNSQPLISKSLPTPQPSTCTSPTSWAIDDLLQFSDFETNDKKESVGFGDQFEWFTDMGLFNDQAAEVPQLPVSKPSNLTLHKSIKSYMPPYKKPRIEISDDEEYFTVPDLG
ncbi:B-box zinc finger protein [Thalictrum thalictroides]|uniref:B-box zinc finger protein n=1 Tax=Thalictrum thalictroides TaxID=46969 RepID=A0A7J6VHH9_THATH|nr:B-box zinc finger protein [Thalictrum thalictroides]